MGMFTWVRKLWWRLKIKKVRMNIHALFLGHVLAWISKLPEMSEKKRMYCGFLWESAVEFQFELELVL